MDNDGRAVEEIIGPDRRTKMSSPTHGSTPDPDTSSNMVPSSPNPGDVQVFSDPIQAESESELSSPPASPPSRLPSPAPTARKASFSFLKRKRSIEKAELSQPKEKQPLKEIAYNARKPPRLGRKSALTQMQLDLGGEIRKTCVQCGMEYIPSNKEDAALHSDFHDLNSTGIEIGQVLLKDSATRSIAPENKPLRDGEVILVVDRQSSVLSRNKIKKILDVVNGELSAPHISDEDLWSGLEPKDQVVLTRKRSNQGSGSGGPRFKAFVYLVNARCVACCLMEKISAGYSVIKISNEQGKEEELGANARSSSISISDRPEAVLLGVTRIWTSRPFRRKGIAEILLDCARRHFFYGMEVTKDLVAFSQPTESGAQLARRWYGAETGWHVFRDKQ